MLHANAVFWFTGGAIAIGLSWLVYMTAPRRKVNRILAVLLFLEGGGMAVGGFEQLVLATPPFDIGTLRALDATFVVYLPVLPLYVLFIAVALDLPWVAPLRRPWAGVALMLPVVPVMVYLLGHPEALKLDDGTPGPAWDWLWPASALVSLFGLVASVDAWRRAPAATLRRRRAAAFAWAFGIRDVAWIGFTAYNALFDVRSIANLVAAQLPFLVWGALTVTYFLVLAYGILREQLFDIDLKIKWTMKRGTVAGIFVAVFLVGFAVAEQFLQERYGWLIGGVAVGLLLIALRPLERAAGRLADAAMPNVRDSAEYRTVRKREVYRATVEGALMDGTISERERDMLARLQDQLALTGTEAREIEREARTATTTAS